MGLKEWILKKFYKVEVPKLSNLNKNDTMVIAADEYLKRAMVSHNETSRIAERLNRAKLLEVQTKNLKNALKDGLEDDDDEDEEEEDDEDEEEDDGLGDKFGKMAANKLIDTFLGGGSISPLTAAGGLSSPEAVASGSASPLKSKYHKLLDGLSDEQIAVFEKKFGGFLK